MVNMRLKWRENLSCITVYCVRSFHVFYYITWWRHQMEKFSALLALCEGNEFPSQRPVTRSFDVFFDLRLNKRLKQSRRRRFETPMRSLWRRCNEHLIIKQLISRWNYTWRDCFARSGTVACLEGCFLLITTRNTDTHSFRMSNTIVKFILNWAINLISAITFGML